MNALMLLKTDHKTVEALFEQYEKLGDGKDRQKKMLVQKITKELSIHAAIEEQVFYPACRKAMKAMKKKGEDGEDMILEALEEHHIVKWTLSELEKMEPSAERFDAKVTVLMESVRHHVKEEERDLFPKVRKALGAKALADLGVTMERAKKMVPTRPHPRAPDAPPANLVSGLGAAIVDKARDAGRKLVGGMRGRAASAARGHNGHGGDLRKTRANGATARAHH